MKTVSLPFYRSYESSVKRKDNPYRNIGCFDSSSSNDRQYPLIANIVWVVRAAGAYSRFLCSQLDDDRKANFSIIGFGHRVTDYKVNGPVKLAIIRILFWSIGITQNAFKHV